MPTEDLGNYFLLILCLLKILETGLEKVLISPWLVTLLHICGVIPTPQSPISPVTQRDRRRLRIQRRYRRIEWRLFHDVSQCFKCFMIFTSGSRCFTMFYMCFMMFYYVLWCLASHATIGVTASVPARPSISSGIAITLQKSAITPQKSAMAPQGSSISPRMWSHAKLRPEWRLE